MHTAGTLCATVAWLAARTAIRAATRFAARDLRATAVGFARRDLRATAMGFATRFARRELWATATRLTAGEDAAAVIGASTWASTFAAGAAVLQAWTAAAR